MNFLKKNIPHIVAVVIFLLVSYAYHAPLLEGKRLSQHDLMTYQGMSKEIKDFREKTGEETLWTNSMFGGMPSYLIGVQWKGNIFKTISNLVQIGPRPGSYTFITMLFMYIALIMFGVNPWLAIVGAFAYGLSSYNIIIQAAGHNSKAVALAYLPAVIASIYYTLHKRMWTGLAVFGLSMALEIVAGHPQITYYGFMMILIYGVFEIVNAVKQKYIKKLLPRFGALFVVAVIAVGTHFANLYATYEYGKYSIRGKTELSTEKENRTSGLDRDYATQWSYGKMETFNLLIPNLYGGASGSDIGKKSALYKELKKMGVPNAKQFVKNAPTYWGPQPMTSGPVYIGAIIVFLFVLGLFLVKGQIKWWLLTATVLSILLAWGHNLMWFTDLFFDYFPGYNKFRTVSMILVIAQIAMPLLGILAIDKIIKNEISKDDFMKSLKYSTAITGGILLFFILFGKSFLEFSSPSDVQVFGQNTALIQALQNDRASMMISDSIRSLVFILLSAAGIWAFYYKKIKTNVFVTVLAILVLVDLWSVDKRYLNSDNYTSKKKIEQPYTPTKADQFILQDKDPDYRVLNLAVSTFNDASTSYFHKSIGGYHGAKMRRYQELIDHEIIKEMQKIISTLQSQPSMQSINNTLQQLQALNMLNTRYIIYNPDAAPLQNPFALGNAWFVDEVKVVNNADEEIAAVQNFNPAKTAIVDKRFEKELFKFKKDPAATIELVKYEPNHLIYKTKANSDQLAVFSEIYYEKGWNAYIDGKKVPHFRANYVLRAMKIPAGEHTVEFKFEPSIWTIGTTISWISSIILLLGLAFAVYLEVKKKD